MKQELKWGRLITALLIPLALGGLAAFLTREGMADYGTLYKPPLAPPGWVFPAVWTLLYLLMGLASYWIAVAPVSEGRRERALSFYAVQLAANLFWPVFSFGMSAWMAAFFWLLLLLGLVLITLLLFWHISEFAGKLLLPYLLWLLFALYLNLGVAILN